jgi:glyoxalase family protein
MNISGFHHITAIASDAQRTRNFYTDILGLRQVKVSVNADDPTAYHLYYGDGVGSPGTILTFFVWKDAQEGRAGVGQTITVAFSIPQASLGYWLTRLQEKGLKAVGPLERFNEKFIMLKDPDGMTVELVAEANNRDFEAWEEGPVPVEHAIRGFHGITLLERGYEETADFLVNELGMIKQEEYFGTYRFAFAGEKTPSFIDVKVAPDYLSGSMGTGVIHHVAFRAENNQEQHAWFQALSHHGHNVSPILDRFWFRSIYFQEPGGALFEIATESPGFTIDEPREKLGEALMLQPWIEDQRAQIEASLPPFPRAHVR